MAEDHIRYDILAQEALRGVMRKVLAEVARTGLPGNHHFFITFLTGASGVRISTRLRERYPEQMTIVVQFQYWDLKVTDTGFEIGLSFSDVPERLEIPFSAVRGFYDPSVNFELEFDVKTEEASALPAELPVKPKAEAPGLLAVTKKPEPAKKPAEPAKTPPAAEADASGKSADVVSLDAFPQEVKVGSVVNLRIARKKKARAEKENAAAQNRAIHGRTKADKIRTRLDAEQSIARLDAHRIEPKSPGSGR